MGNSGPPFLAVTEARTTPEELFTDEKWPVCPSLNFDLLANILRWLLTNRPRVFGTVTDACALLQQ